MTKKATVKPVTGPVALAAFKPEADMQQLITHAIDKNVAVETMEKLLAMRRELKAEWAREQYHQALAAFQSECPIIKKETIVRNKGGSERYRYAALDSIITQVRGLLRTHGFSFRTNAAVEGTCVTATCVATHSQGHSESSSFMVPTDKEAFMNAPQQFASALTFAKRYAFCNAFGIQTGDQDDDATAARSQPEEAAVEGRAPEGARHRRTRDYENEQDTGPKATGDLLELSTWLKDNSIPEGFVLAMLKEKKLVPPNLAKLGNAPPGVIRRTLDSRDRLAKAFAASSAAPGGDEPPATPAPAKEPERSPFDSEMPPGSRARTTFNGDDGGGMETRQPAQRDTGVAELLAEAGVEDWRQVVIHWGKQKGIALGKVQAKSLVWWITEWHPKPYKGNWSKEDLVLDAALCLAHAEMANAEAATKRGAR